MNVDEALRQMGAGLEFPEAAMRWALDHWDETRQVEWPNPDKVPPPERVDAPVVTQGVEEMPDAMAAREAAEARARLEAETAPA